MVCLTRFITRTTLIRKMTEHENIKVPIDDAHLKKSTFLRLINIGRYFIAGKDSEINSTQLGFCLSRKN